jgi:type I restriction-modification system DNA methylase subunit
MALSNQDKISVVQQHIKNLQLNKYNLEVSIVEENALENPAQSTLDSLNSQISDIVAKLAALDTELTTLQQAGQ